MYYSYQKIKEYHLKNEEKLNFKTPKESCSGNGTFTQ